jgi:hypothetical protein
MVSEARIVTPELDPIALMEMRALSLDMPGLKEALRAGEFTPATTVYKMLRRERHGSELALWLAERNGHGQSCIPHAGTSNVLRTGQPLVPQRQRPTRFRTKGNFHSMMALPRVWIPKKTESAMPVISEVDGIGL